MMYGTHEPRNNGDPAVSAPMDHDHERGKLFVGGLSWETTQDNLQRYFSRYGEVIDCVVMKNNETGRSRGFGFVTFADPDNVERALENGPHTLDGRTIDPKPCNPRSMHKPKRTGGYPKVFLGGLPPNVTETDLRNFFSRYGNVMEVVIMYDQEKKKSRGFGFLSFENDPAVDRATAEHFVNLNGKQVEIKKAEPRDGGMNNQNAMSQDPYQWGAPHGQQMGNGQMPPIPPMGAASSMMQGYGAAGWGSQQPASYAGYGGSGANSYPNWGATAPPQQWGFNNAGPQQSGTYAGYDMYTQSTPSAGGYGSTGANWTANTWNQMPPTATGSTNSATEIYSRMPPTNSAGGPPSAATGAHAPGTASKPGSEYNYGAATAAAYGNYYAEQTAQPPTGYNQTRPRSAYGANEPSFQPTF